MNLEEIKQIIDAYENDKPWQFTLCGHKSCCRGKINTDQGGVVDLATIIKWDNISFEVLPDTIGSEVNGFILPEGKNWHRSDFTHDMLKGGYRPLIENECIEAGDEVVNFIDLKTWSVWTRGEILEDALDRNQAKPGWSHHRTKRPIIPDGYTKHDGSCICPVDPDRKVDVLYSDESTNKHISAFAVSWGYVIAYRTYPDPFAELKAAYKNGATILFKEKNEDKWERAHIDDDSGELGWYDDYDYKLAPKQIPLDRNDIAAGDVIELDNKRYLVRYDSYSYGQDIAIGNRIVDYGYLKSCDARINRSFYTLGTWDENAWEPCCKDDPNS